MGKEWIRTNGKLWNLGQVTDINEPIFMGGAPGYWVIGYRITRNKVEMFESWTFVTENEARETFSKIEKILTVTTKFVE